MSGNKLAEAARARLTEIDKEREHLLAIVEIHGNGNGASPAQAKSRPAPTSVQAGLPFAQRPSGPTERIMTVVSQNPGMKYGQIVGAALEGMDTEADHPRRSLGSTLGSLVKRGKIRKADGRYYPK